ncbi:MAG TPA: 4-alpha-glucanotransferase [Blastocatellia bacterium]|nr:4-alpha-glucanotransferase [Blastocatellia bacterium]
MIYPRWGGILLHPTSLPGRFGIGDLGDQAYAFIDFLVESGLNLWQVLPLGPTGYGDSPYQCFSAFAGNPLLVSPERLVVEGLLTEEDLRDAPSFPEDRVDFGRVIDYKSSLLRRAYRRFNENPPSEMRAGFLAFSRASASWLDDYALFRALKNEHNGAPWNMWGPELALRDPDALAAARDRLHGEVESEKFYQYLFFRQWAELRQYCHKRDVQIIGDMPIFVAYDSTEVWTSPDMFKLDEKGNPLVIAGVPPDYFSKTGQLWGNPIYDWDRMIKTGFQWWTDRFRATFELVDIVRVDHFRGFSATWEIPANEQTAVNGRWVDVPGRKLFATLKHKMGELPIIAEDLGVITPDVEALRDEFGFPGMRILQFAFRADSGNLDLPHNYVNNTIVYTGTHDNDTTVGWFNSKAGTGSTRSAEQIESERALCLKYFKSEGEEINWDFIEAAFRSAARMALAPLQDVLALGSEARMNLPASQEGNWKWRFRAGDLTGDLSDRLRHLAEFYNRGQSYVRPHPVS